MVAMMVALKIPNRRKKLRNIIPPFILDKASPNIRPLPWQNHHNRAIVARQL
jgi:hypothetical protein